jgi:hypothetical protein
MANLTRVLRSINQIQDLPAHRRMAAARALIPVLDEALTQADTDTATNAWMRLARYGTGRRVDLAVRDLTPDVMRSLAIEALKPGDPIAAVTEARAGDKEAQAAAIMARRGLMQAVGDGRRSGVTVDRLMAAAGVSRQTVYDWERETAPVADGEAS